MWTKEQQNKWRREYRKKTANISTRRYEKSRKGFLMRKYRNMQSRVLGIQSKKAHLYKGLSLLSREDFYDWAYNHAQFLRLYVKWRNNNYDRKLCPTVDRVDPSKGYEIGNIEWVTHSENSRRGSLNRHKLKI